MTRGKLQTAITSDRQRYVDDPVYVVVSDAKPLALAVNTAFARIKPRPVLRPRIEVLTDHDRFPLLCIKLDERGRWVPKHKK